MDDELAGLLGEPPARTVRSSEGDRILTESLRVRNLAADALPIASDFVRPVGITFIAEVAKKQPAQIKRRLAKCPIVGYRKYSGKDQPLYDFLTAMAHLLEPKGSIEDYLASRNAATLPPYLNKMYWDASVQRNRALRTSGDLWHTEDVVLTLGRVALMLKEEMKMWVEDLPGRQELTSEQYAFLTGKVTQLQNSVRERMIDMPAEFTTHSMAHTIAEELKDGGRLPDGQLTADELHSP